MTQEALRSVVILNEVKDLSDPSFFNLLFAVGFSTKSVMKVTRIYTGPDGHSHFDEVEVEIGKLQPGEGIVFRHEPPGRVQEWHPAPRRQYVVTLSGEGEIEISD